MPAEPHAWRTKSKFKWIDLTQGVCNGNSILWENLNKHALYGTKTGSEDSESPLTRTGYLADYLEGFHSLCAHVRTRGCIISINAGERIPRHIWRRCSASVSFEVGESCMPAIVSLRNMTFVRRGPGRASRREALCSRRYRQTIEASSVGGEADIQVRCT